MKRYLVISVYTVLILSTLLVFWRVRNFDFVNYDDDVYVYENQHVLKGLTPDGIIWAFTTGYASNWHPMTWLSLMLDCQLFGPNPGRIHLVNLFLHIVNSLLLFAVLKKMTGSLWPSAFVAAAFALHPMHVESVAWIAERKDVLSALFWMLTLLSYISYVKRPAAFRYFVTITIFAIGILTKPMLVTLPFVLLLLDYWPLDRFSKPLAPKTSCRKPRKISQVTGKRSIQYQIVIEKIPFFAIAAISSVVTFLVQRGGGAVTDMNTLPLNSRIANAVLAYVIYLYKMVWPQNLSVFYPFYIDRFSSWQIVLCVLLLLVIFFLVFWFGRERKYLPIGWFWFVGTLIPVIGLVRVGEQAYADRYTYIPYIGLFIMMAWGLPELLPKWPYRKIAIGISTIIVLAALGICTYMQVSCWNNSSTLFSHAIEVAPDNYLAYNKLGQDFSDHNDITSAIEHYKKALQIMPNYGASLYNLGCLMCDKGNFKEAIEYLQQAVKFKPDFAEAYNNLGLAMQTYGNREAAIVNLARAVQLQPYLIKPRNNLANALISSGKFNDAVEQLRQILHIRPNTVTSLNNLALLIVKHPELKDRNLDEAIGLARRACELTNYRNATFLDTLALTYLSAGKFSEAVRTAEAVLNIDPNLASAHRILGAALLSEGYFKEAIVYIKRSLEMEPNNIGAKNNLAWILATSPDLNIRNPSVAISLAQEACNATNFKDPTVLDTLGAAYACEGRFADAVETAQKALGLADGANQIQIKNTIERHLIFYKQNKPYVESVKEVIYDVNKP